MTESSQTNEFLRLLMANQKRIYAFILGMVPNHQDADDLFQETVLVMWSKFDSFSRGSSFSAWGTTIARYQVLGVRKRFSRRNLQFSDMARELLQAESSQFVEGMDDRMHALRNCVSKLNKDDYELIRLRYEDEAAIQSIADRMGRSVQSVYRKVARIHDALLRCIRRTVSEELA